MSIQEIKDVPNSTATFFKRRNPMTCDPWGYVVTRNEKDRHHGAPTNRQAGNDLGRARAPSPRGDKAGKQETPSSSAP
jgi:hypothetical protein